MIPKINLTDEINEAVTTLKEEKGLISSDEAIAKILSNWVIQQLKEIEWHSHNSSISQK